MRGLIRSYRLFKIIGNPTFVKLGGLFTHGAEHAPAHKRHYKKYHIQAVCWAEKPLPNATKRLKNWPNIT